MPFRFCHVTLQLHFVHWDAHIISMVYLTLVAGAEKSLRLWEESKPIFRSARTTGLAFIDDFWRGFYYEARTSEGATVYPCAQENLAQWDTNRLRRNNLHNGLQWDLTQWHTNLHNRRQWDLTRRHTNLHNRRQWDLTQRHANL